MPRDEARAELYRTVVGAALLGLVVNLGLGLAKLVGGLVGGSFALISDAVNSLGDVVTSVAVLLALRLAQRPADPRAPLRPHPGRGGRRARRLGARPRLGPAGRRPRRSAGCRMPHPLPPAWTLGIAGGERRDQGGPLPLQDPARPSDRLQRPGRQRLGPPGRRLQRPGRAGRPGGRPLRRPVADLRRRGRRAGRGGDHPPLGRLADLGEHPRADGRPGRGRRSSSGSRPPPARSPRSSASRRFTSASRASSTSPTSTSRSTPT